MYFVANRQQKEYIIKLCDKLTTAQERGMFRINTFLSLIYMNSSSPINTPPLAQSHICNKCLLLAGTPLLVSLLMVSFLLC
jgi:hypothetical protein